MNQTPTRRVLIVDDDGQNLYMLRALLQGHGWTVDEAQHGAQALARAAAVPPDLVISDLLMPVMDGYTLLRRWKQDPRLQQIPFIVYTATYTEPKDERLALALGAGAFIIKPAEPESFMARLVEVLDNAGSQAASAPPMLPSDALALLADYNETLLRKLEKRSVQLERTNSELRDQIAQGRRKEEEIRQLNVDLEKRVAERTAELSAARTAAEAANLAKSTFLANMSHEIRTPMNAIIGLTHLMARDSADAVQRERLAKVDAAARHLLQVINDILDLSKIDAGKMTLLDTEFSLDQTLARAFEMVGTAAHDKGLELVLAIDHVPDRLRGDPTRLSQAVINLLSNAVKFTDVGWVRLGGEVLAEEPHRIQVRFEVQDTGPGITEAQQRHLFTPFEQVDASHTRRHDGTGLGLALTRHLARLMGGEVGLDSVPGRGSRFWFTAWLARGAEAGEASIPLSGLRALLIDDLPESLAAIGERLKELGVEVDPQTGGSAGLQRLHNAAAAGRPFDVVLIDWRMPPPDGIDTLRQARALLGPRTPPSILVTAFDEDPVRQQARDAGFDAVLTKPVTASLLNDALMQALRHAPRAAAEGPQAPGDVAQRLRRGHAGQRILLVEDNAVNREVAEELLRSVGLLVETAHDGHRAVELALLNRCDLILMDMQMPGLDGLAATREIRRRGGRGVPIIAMTAHAFNEDRQACLDAGMNDHVAKPVDPDLLYATLLRWMPQPRPPAEADATGPSAGGAGPLAPLETRLAEQAGLDTVSALRHVGGQLGTLERVLRRFVAAYSRGVPALVMGPTPTPTPSPSPATIEGWRAACHSLLGACATIGARDIHQQLLAFQSALGAAGATGDTTVLAVQAQALQHSLVTLASRIESALAA